MSQFLAQIPRQLLRQEQRLTPQLIQAMDILQLPLLALEARIDQEMDSNPALEAVGEDELEAGAADRNGSDANGEIDPTQTETPLGRDESAGEFERLDSLVSEYPDAWEDDFDGGTRSRSRLMEEGDQKLEAMQNTASRPVGLHDNLLEQWQLADVDERTQALGELMINALDDHGRLSIPLPQFIDQVTPPATLPQLEYALAEVQQLEPVGIGARSLQESLLLQLDALPQDAPLERRIIADQFEELQKNRLPQIAKALGVEIEQIKDAIGVIARLRLNPAARIVSPATPPIQPDVIVEYDAEADRYDVRLARGNTRELRISPEFRAELERARHDKATRDFVKQKIEAANAIIDALRFRRERLLDVARAVVDAQRDFLDQGEQHLKVLRMSDLAERFQCDPSTISRTVDEKYIQTPRGIFPLRRFFTGGTESGAGEALGWDSIKAKVQEIVAGEDKRDPLNDDQIVDQLQAQGIDIKRRTVAKYRAQLGIPLGRQRRQF